MARRDGALNQTANAALPAAWYAASSLAHEATLRQQLLWGKRADGKMKLEELNSDTSASRVDQVAHLQLGLSGNAIDG